MGEPKVDLKKVVSAAKSEAESAESGNGGKLVAGPFDVGNIGQVSVVERTSEKSGKSYTYAEFSGMGRPSRIPLAAAATIAEQLG